MRKTCLQEVYQLAQQHSEVVFIGSDLGAGTLSEFKCNIPDRFFMEGICEANVIGMAVGMAMNGKVPYVNTIASFLTRRSYEQVAIDMCLHNANVRLIGNGGGLVYAPLGPTHEATDDLALMRALPGMCIVAVADADEMRRLMPLTVHYPGPMYIRLAKGHDPIVTEETLPFEIGKGVIYASGSDVLLVTTGITLGLAKEAAAILEFHGISTGILHLHTVKPLDQDVFLEMCASVRAVVTLEEHSICGGLGSACAELFAEHGFQGTRFRRLALPDIFTTHYGSQAALMQEYGLNVPNIVSVVNAMLEG